MQPKTSWSFTARPDFPRICRELEQVGSIVGRVTMKGENPVTLVDMHSAAGRNVVRSNAKHAYVAGTNHRWVVLAGDVTRQVLGIAPVTVDAFGPGSLMVDVETALVTPGAVAPPAAAPIRYGVFDRYGRRSRLHPATFTREDEARSYLFGRDRTQAAHYSIRPLPIEAQIRSVQQDPPAPPPFAPKWGLFLHLDQTRSQDYPKEFDSQDAAMAAVPFGRKTNYYAKELVLGA